MFKDSDLSPYQPIPKHKPDRLTYIVRFVCGAMVGLILGCMASVYFIRIVARIYDYRNYAFEFFECEPVLYTVGGVAILIFVLVFGFGAMILGDRFWGSVIDR